MLHKVTFFSLSLPFTRPKGNIVKRIERKFRLFIRKNLIKGKVFYWLVLILVLLNTISMSLTRYNQPVHMKETLGEFVYLVSIQRYFNIHLTTITLKRRWIDVQGLAYYLEKISQEVFLMNILSEKFLVQFWFALLCYWCYFSLVFVYLMTITIFNQIFWPGIQKSWKYFVWGRF